MNKVLLCLLLLFSTNLYSKGWTISLFTKRPNYSSGGNKGYIILRDAIMDKANKYASHIDGAEYIQIIRSFSVLTCKRSPFFVIKIMDKDKKNIGFMLYGLDTVAGKNDWRLIIHEKELDAFNEYCKNTPFHPAVIENPDKLIVSVC